MTYIKKNVLKPGGISPGSAAAKEPNVTIVLVDDILVFPPSDMNGVRMMGNFVMKPGAKMYQFYSTKSKISAPFESDGDEDSVNIKPTFDAQHPGNGLEIKEFVQNWLGKNVIIIHGSCQDDFREVIGTMCAPLQLMPAKQDNNEGRFYTLKFQSFAASALLPKHYTGDLAFAEPTIVANAAAVNLAPVTGTQYRLPASEEATEVAVTANTLEHGQTVSLIGSGGSDPIVLSPGATVLLKNGTQWLGLNNSVIQLQVFDTGASTVLIEVSRS